MYSDIQGILVMETTDLVHVSLLTTCTVTFRVSSLWKLLIWYMESDPTWGIPNWFFSVSNEKERGLPGSPSSKIMEIYKFKNIL